MPTISGGLFFDKQRTASVSASMSGIENVPIVLHNVNSGLTLAVLTNASGNYSFINVPNGDYMLMECYGFAPALPTPADFSTATQQQLLTGAITPPIGYAPNPPLGATHLDCTIKNTRLVSVAGSNLTGQNFLNAPVTHTPITTILDDGVVVLPQNLILNADGGTFGQFSAATNANTGASPLPYTNLETDFKYVQPNPASVTPNDGQFTIQNLMNNSHSNSVGTWWVVADHTLGNEAGRMMVVNGYNPGAVIYKESVQLKPHTYYLFSAWILNMCKKATGYANPSLGVTIFSQDGEVIYEATLGELIPIHTTNPEWKQIGTAFYTAHHSTLSLQFTSMGPAATGNDYALDDIAINEIVIPAHTPIKSVDKQVVLVGDSLQFAISLPNAGHEPLTNVWFSDQLAQGLEFVEGSVIVNGESMPELNPNTGFNVADIAGGEQLCVSFKAVAVSIPAQNPVPNTAHLSYSYSPVQGGIPIEYKGSTNEVLVRIDEPNMADLMIQKQLQNRMAIVGNEMIYELTITNLGQSAALDVVLTDEVSPLLMNVQYSEDEQVTWNTWEGSLELGQLESGSSLKIYIRGVLRQTYELALKNTASVQSSTPDPDISNNSASTINDIVTPTDDEMADLEVVKTAQHPTLWAGDVQTYTIRVTNLGPDAAHNIYLADRIPQSLQNAEYSLQGVDWLPWNGEYMIGTLMASQSTTIYIRATVSADATQAIVNTAVAAGTTLDPDLSDNASTVVTPLQAQADLAIEKSASTQLAAAGDSIEYTLTITNHGPSGASDIMISDALPATLLNAQFSLDGGQSFEDWRGYHTLESLQSGEQFLLIIRATVSPAAINMIANTATVQSTTPDPNPSNNSAQNEIAINTWADLEIKKVAQAQFAQSGNQLLYSIRVTNHGISNAKSVVVADPIPSQLLDAQYSTDGGVEWNEWSGTYNMDELASGEMATILVRATVDEAAQGIITNTARVMSATLDPNPANNTSSISVPIAEEDDHYADLSVIKVAHSAHAHPCQPLTYTIIVSNHGNTTAQNVLLTDIMPSSLLNPRYSKDGGNTWHTWNGSLSLASIEPCAHKSILIRACVSRCANRLIKNTATVTTTTKEINLCNNTFTHTIRTK